MTIYEQIPEYIENTEASSAWGRGVNKYAHELIGGLDKRKEPENGSIYEVTIVRTGSVFVRASTSAAAMDLADHLTTDHVNWSDDWSPTDAEERSDYDGMVFEEPDFD